MLSQKNGIVYKKALTILESITSLAAKTLSKNQMDDELSYSLYILGNVYKLLASHTSNIRDHEYIEALLVLTFFLLPKCNASTILSSPIYSGLNQILLQLLTNTSINLTPLACKYSLAALT